MKRMSGVRASWIGFAVGAVCCAALWVSVGCSKRSEGDVAEVPAQEGSVPSEEVSLERVDSDVPTTVRAPDGTELPVDSVAHARPDTSRPERVIDERGFGERLDQAFNRLDNAYVYVSTQITEQPDGARLDGAAELKFDRDGRFRLEYYLMETRQALNVIVSDGEVVAKQENWEWSSLNRQSRSSAPPMTTAELARWSTEFPREMLRYYSDGTPVWGPLFAAWEQGVGGYSVTITEQPVTIRQGQSSVYRVVATTDQGRPTRIEMTIESSRMVPHAIRSEVTLPNGKSRVISWVAQWGFGGEHDASNFRIPSGVLAQR